MESQESQPQQPKSLVKPAPGFLRGGIARIVLIGLGIIVLLVVLLVGGFSLLKSSRSQPPSIEKYPNATIITQNASANSDYVTYSTTDSIDRVADFYIQRLGKSDESGCKRIYTDKEPSDQSGHSFYRCAVDSSMLEIAQRVEVTITYQADPANPNGGQTLIAVSRNWGAAK